MMPVPCAANDVGFGLGTEVSVLEQDF
jgi:hypothetical protein